MRLASARRARDDCHVPQYWLRLSASPPEEVRNRVRRIVNEHGGTLITDEVYFPTQAGAAFALVEAPSGPKARQMLAALEPQNVLPLVNVRDKNAGNRHPPAP